MNRSRLPRFHVRTLMIAVAIVAALLVYARSSHYRGLAALQAETERSHLASLSWLENYLRAIKLHKVSVVDEATEAEHLREIEARVASKKVEAANASALRRAYERAAWLPWHRVESAPPGK